MIQNSKVLIFAACLIKNWIWGQSTVVVRRFIQIRFCSEIPINDTKSTENVKHGQMASLCVCFFQWPDNKFLVKKKKPNKHRKTNMGLEESLHQSWKRQTNRWPRGMKSEAFCYRGNCDWDLEVSLLISDTRLFKQKVDRKGGGGGGGGGDAAGRRGGRKGRSSRGTERQGRNEVTEETRHVHRNHLRYIYYMLQVFFLNQFTEPSQIKQKEKKKYFLMCQALRQPNLWFCPPTGCTRAPSSGR